MGTDWRSFANRWSLRLWIVGGAERPSGLLVSLLTAMAALDNEAAAGGFAVVRSSGSAVATPPLCWVVTAVAYVVFPGHLQRRPQSHLNVIAITVGGPSGWPKSFSLSSLRPLGSGDADVDDACIKQALALEDAHSDSSRTVLLRDERGEFLALDAERFEWIYEAEND